MNIWIVEIMCASGYKISDVCYDDQPSAERFVDNQIGDQKAIVDGKGTIIAEDGTVYRIRPLLLRK